MQPLSTTQDTENARKSSYDDNGFYLAREPVFPPDLVAQAVAGMDAVRTGEYDTGRPPQPSAWKPGDDPNRLCKIEQPQFASTALRDLLNYPALGQIAGSLTGARSVQAWWVQLLVKPALPAGTAAATNVGWHQDRYYWSVWEEGSELFTAWIALSDVTDESGAMRFVRGSHRWGLLPSNDFFAQDIADQQRSIPLPAGADWQETAAILPPGGVSFHDDYTLHASGPNNSDGPRRSLAVHLRTEKSRPVGDIRKGLAEFIDDPELCPTIYRRP